MKKIINLFSILCILPFMVSAQKKTTSISMQPATLVLNIQINTSDTTIKINDTILKTFDIKNIQKLLGKPDRIKMDTSKSYYEKFGTKSNPSSSRLMKVVNYYYIYDKLGIAFYTNNGSYETKEPEKFSIHFKNKRTFTDLTLLPFSPVNAFTGVLQINGITVSSAEKTLPKDVDYKTEKFKLFNTSFGSTSIATVIDRLYSENSEPNLSLFLDTEKDQRISYIVVNH